MPPEHHARAPARQEAQPVGTVFLGVAIGDDVTSRYVRLPGDRERIRQFACISVLDLLRRQLLGSDPVGILGAGPDPR